MPHMISARLCLDKSTIHKHTNTAPLHHCAVAHPPPPQSAPARDWHFTADRLGACAWRARLCASAVRLWVCEVAVVQTRGDPHAGNPLNSPNNWTHKRTQISRRRTDCRLYFHSPTAHGWLVRSNLLFEYFFQTVSDEFHLLWVYCNRNSSL